MLRAGTALVSALCVVAATACDGPWELDDHKPGVRNASPLEEAVAIQTYRGPFSCESAGSGSAVISLALLAEPEIFTLVSGATASLASASSTSSDGGVPSRDCGAAVVSSGRLETPLLITWDLRDAPGVKDLATDAVLDGNVYLEQFGDELRPAAGPGMFVDSFRREEAAP